MTHSHIPVAHLLKQVECYRSRRSNRGVRPDWIHELLDRTTDLFEPLCEVARVGFECRLDDDRWHVRLYLGRTEIVGGPNDGESRHTGFTFDVSRLLAILDGVESLRWSVSPESADPVPPEAPRRGASCLTIEGHFADNPVRLQIPSIPPAEAGPAFRRYPDGGWDPV